MALMARSFSWSDLKLTALFAPVLVHDILKLYRLCV